MVVVTKQEKPLALIALLLRGKIQLPALCFTRSVTSSHRLYLLLKFFGGITVAEYSSELAQQQRTEMLDRFRSGQVKLLSIWHH